LERSDRLWDALDQTDAEPTTWTAPAAPEPAAPRPALGGARRSIATALLAAGLLIVGGVAVVNAAFTTGNNSGNNLSETEPISDTGSVPEQAQEE